MAITLDDFCAEVNNYFDSSKFSSRYFGVFTITNGSIDLSGTDIVENQYFRIVNSKFNDGVYKYPVTSLSDEEFDGAVWLMSVPPAVISLVEEINAWLTKYEKVGDSPFSAESYSGYSYNLKDGAEGADAGTWQSVFHNRLNRYRKLSAI